MPYYIIEFTCSGGFDDALYGTHFYKTYLKSHIINTENIIKYSYVTLRQYHGAYHFDTNYYNQKQYPFFDLWMVESITIEENNFFFFNMNHTYNHNFNPYLITKPLIIDKDIFKDCYNLKHIKIDFLRHSIITKENFELLHYQHMEITNNELNEYQNYIIERINLINNELSKYSNYFKSNLNIQKYRETLYDLIDELCKMNCVKIKELQLYNENKYYDFIKNLNNTIQNKLYILRNILIDRYDNE